MARWARHVLWPVLLGCLWYAPAAGQDYWNYKTAYDAYDAGEFQLAAYMYKRLARKGDPRAQNDLGFLYSVGQGVPQDFKTAAGWFRKAAAQGYAPAVMQLAGLYAEGRGVDRDPVEAYKFFTLAAHLFENPNRRRIALSRRDNLAAGLTASQTAQAGDRACRWWRTHGDRITKARRRPSLTLPQCTAD